MSPNQLPSLKSWFLKVTLHQGAIEAIFLDSMTSFGVHVERPLVPTSLEISDDPKELADPHSYPVKVGYDAYRRGSIYIYINVKVLLKRLDGDEDTEVVRAKYVVGADGA